MSKNTSMRTAVKAGGVGGVVDIMAIVSALTPRLQMKPVHINPKFINPTLAMAGPTPYAKLPQPRPTSTRGAQKKSGAQKKRSKNTAAKLY